MAALVKQDEALNTSKRDETITSDHEFVKSCLPPAAIQTLTKDIISVVIMRTPYARVQLRVQNPEGYPDETPIVELSSPTLPMPLLRNKERECIAKADEVLGTPQFSSIYQCIYSFIHTNMFIPCWKEMKQVANLCEGKGQLGAEEKEGVVQIRLKVGKYRQIIKLKVPYDYPTQGVEIEWQVSNFPEDIQFMFRSQAEEITRRCVAGFSPEQALQISNPLELPSTKNTSNEPKTKVTAGSLKSLKHDVNVLKQMSDLRVATTAKDKKNQYFTEGNAERREARKDLRRLAKAETETEIEEQKRQLEEEENEMKLLMNQKVSDVAQPSLFPVARFLVEDYVLRLPKEPCQACQKPVLPLEPGTENVTPAGKKSKKNMKAMRSLCGHWFHWDCLNEWLTTPPFLRFCPLCDNRRVWHPDWPEDYKQIEKAWQLKEARKREVSDVSDFMGMDDEFLTDAAISGNLC